MQLNDRFNRCLTISSTAELRMEVDVCLRLPYAEFLQLVKISDAKRRFVSENAREYREFREVRGHAIEYDYGGASVDL